MRPLCFLLLIAACTRGPAGSAARDGAASSASRDGGDPARDGGVEVFQATDGSRLKARWMEGPDGTRTLWGWYDTTLEAPCRFTRAADGELRCLPEGPVWSSAYADASCTAMAVVRPYRACEAPDAFAVRWDADACPRRQHIHRVGERLAPDQVFEDSASGCRRVHQLPLSASARLGDEVPPADFVKGRLVEWPGGSGQGPRAVLLEAEDGARQNFSWRQGDVACTFLRLGDGRLRCVPEWSNRSFGSFSDASCQQPAAAVETNCPAPRVYVEALPGQCPARSKVHEIGARLTTRYDLGPGGCAPSVVGGVGIDFHTVGARLPDEVFPAIALVDEPTNHPLQRQIALTGGRAVTWGWRDQQRGPCFPLLYQGKRLCVPSASESFAYHYADAGCTQPLWRRARDRCPAEFVNGADHHSGCPQKRILYRVGEGYTGLAFQLVVSRTGQDGDRLEYRCQPVADDPAEAFHRLIAIPDEQLLELKLVEPF